MPENIRIKIIRFLIDFNEKIFFEKKLKRFYKNKSEIKTIVDVGANKGQSIDFFLKLNPSCVIYAFEPNPKLFSFLNTKYKTNNNVKLFNYGISDTIGEKLFFENVLDYTSSFEPLNYNSNYLERKAKILGYSKETIIKNQYNVFTNTLSNFFSIHQDISAVDVLKIDTEGHEFNCLTGLFQDIKLPKIKYIQLESHSDDMFLNSKNSDKILNLLGKNNFREKARIKHGFGNFEEIIYMLQ